PAILGWALTLFSVNIFWVFFRAKDLAGSAKVLKAMVDYKSIGSFITISYRETANPYFGNMFTLIILILAILISFIPKNSYENNGVFKPNKLYFLKILILLVASFYLLERVSEFLYFNF
ncbi:MAG: MBOAT family protein, partial [Fusobacteriaceae bacterium]